MPSSPGVFPDFIYLMAAKMSSNFGGFAMSSSLSVAGQFSRCLNILSTYTELLVSL